MYTENNNGGLLRSIILKLLFIALFIFLLLWLYPSNNTKPFYDAIFNNNIMMMKEVAEDYYTVQRLPKEVGEKHKLTLKEMLDMKLLLPFTDKNGEYCDNEKSYVQVTKLENDEYELKVTLSCKDKTDYIIVYLGCHDLCVDGKCETVVSIIEYKFERELVKGRKPVKKDIYKYEYSKEVPETYVTEVPVTYYKGKKKVSEDTYTYEYTKPDRVPYEIKNKVTYYQGQKKISNEVYKHEYIKPYEIVTPVAPTCKTYYNQSSCPSGTSCTKNTKTVTVPDGYTYGPWTTTNSFESTTPVPATATDTTRTISNGYTYKTGVCNKSSCPKTQIVYKYLTQTRTKTTNKKNISITTYTYQICTNNPANVTSGTERKWSTEDLTKQGWTKTGNKELVQAAKYDKTDWVKQLPSGYTKINEKVVEEKTIGYNTITRKEWSTEDLTKQGWTKTGNKELVKSGEYTYTDWVKQLPSEYEQTDKKVVNEKTTAQRMITKKEWSTEDLTKQGWTKTGNKEKIGEKTDYQYTGWVTKLPEGYEQIDKKLDVKWSTEKELSGWKKTNDSRVKEEK